MDDLTQIELVELRLRLNREVHPGASLVVAAHHFGFSAVDDDAQVEVGQFDITDMRSVVNEHRESPDSEENVLDLKVIGRYSVGPRAALSLLDTAQKLVRYYHSRGHFEDGEGEPTTDATDSS